MTRALRYRRTVGVVLVVLVGFVLGASASYGQLVAELSAEKDVYGYGEEIIVTFRLSNPTAETVAFSSSCPPIIRFDTFEFPVICFTEDWHYYGPGSWRSWTLTIRPSEYGIPASSGQHTIIGSYYTYLESIDIEAPKYLGGQVRLEFLSSTAPSVIDAIRQSLNGLVVNTDVRSNGNVTETWTIEGVTIDDAILQYQSHASVVNISHSFPPADYVSVDIDEPLDVPRTFSLDQNYPNPFNPETTISYSIARTGLVELKVHNVLGELVETLENRVLTPGEHESSFDASGLATGIYFYTLTDGDFSQTRKMVVLR